MEWILLLLVGLLAGTIGSIMGLGGGIIVVPALLLLQSKLLILSGITPQIAVGTSLFIMIFTGLSATISYIKQKQVDFKNSVFFLCGMIPGVLYGVTLNKTIDVDSFLTYFGLFIIGISFLFLLPRKNSENAQTSAPRVNWIVAVLISFVVGTFSGLFGIGGGTIMVPAMILLFHFSPHAAVATSMFMIIFTSLVGSISHLMLGNVHWLYACVLIPGAWAGGKLGAFINKKLKNKTLVIMLRIFLCVIGLRLII
ncbi:sulfite exporter TauE/SafE family protein [Bacillus alkalicellulosilyticus]|uniref:sulfite exporter TauE/SafE family protein n=1 Tax=Alkalihalobacterium alkalicellulosilyticum TaxID=1912214 RepID=UPI0009973692|nr:sulfite exporter TauE/SafE family protein [Bacillus alkalicellulosilyticus]